MRPEDVPEEIVLAALAGGEPASSPTCDMAVVAFNMAAAIAAVWPLIAQAERERCAKVAQAHADGHANSMHAYGTADKDAGRGRQEGHIHAAEAIASAIRALPDTGE